MRFIYMVQFDWSTEDYGEIETELFGTYKRALDHFHTLIQNEKNPALSWVGDQALDEYGNVNEGYELDFLYAEGKTINRGISSIRAIITDILLSTLSSR